MNVLQLKEKMEELVAQGCGEMDVVYSYNYGDYWRTTVAPGVDTVESGTVKYSDYHSMDKVIDPYEDDCEMTPKPNQREVIILG